MNDRFPSDEDSEEQYGQYPEGRLRPWQYIAGTLSAVILFFAIRHGIITRQAQPEQGQIIIIATNTPTLVSRATLQPTETPFPSTPTPAVVPVPVIANSIPELEATQQALRAKAAATFWGTDTEVAKANRDLATNSYMLATAVAESGIDAAKGDFYKIEGDTHAALADAGEK
jgi:hypothetical protein